MVKMMVDIKNSPYLNHSPEVPTIALTNTLFVVVARLLRFSMRRLLPLGVDEPLFAGCAIGFLFDGVSVFEPWQRHIAAYRKSVQIAYQVETPW